MSISDALIVAGFLVPVGYVLGLQIDIAIETHKRRGDPFVEWIHRPLDPIDAVDQEWIDRPVLHEVLSEEGQGHLRLARRSFLKHPTDVEALETQIENLLAGRLPWEDR